MAQQDTANSEATDVADRPSGEAIQDILEQAARQWCTPKSEGRGSWQEFLKLIDKPEIDWSAGRATCKFAYLDRDEVLSSVDHGSVVYDIKAGKVVSIRP
eukprot:gb/GFBE01049941.1/.p1 GENE.gb/GFBE01049941.1/~~gb/GFBE01049941.1/.p1  ORF type:complete len:100 (+),score=27.74 gb/GFBE01049941.1/:1-300(+)